MKDSTKTLNHLFRFIKPENYLEIGVRYAETINVLAEHCKKVVGIDPDINCKKYITNSVIEFKNTTSDDFFNSHSGLKFNAIFIDGLHTYEQVKKDYRNSLNCLADNGWVFLHDTFPPDINHTKANLCGNVWKFADELKNTIDLREYEFLTLPWGYGITCIHKRNKQVDF